MTAIITLDNVLADLRAHATGIRDKGTLFEELVVRYLQADPVYTARFSDVMPYGAWTHAPSRKDTGIDLVAIERDGGVCAIQCKFFEPTHTLQKSDIDSFFTASGKAPFTSRLIISTTDKWSSNAEDALSGQQIDVARIGLQDIADGQVEWALLHNGHWPTEFKRKKRHAVRKHQREAINDVIAGFAANDRGKLIMACGTGKTFTALKLVEETIAVGGSVLFLAPSISLISQSLREWSAQTETPMRFLAVCSDTTVGKGRRTTNRSEDISAHDLVIPPTTTAEKVALHGNPARDPERVTVTFSTYQSIDVIAGAQKQGLPAFDLIICDEAHRTTGATLADEDESDFVKVHRNDLIHGAKRLYMTATPRVYGPEAKKKADEGSVELVSMDKVEQFGPTFHELTFGKAVDQNLLTDYKVLILNISEEYASRTLQNQLADENLEINLDDAAKLVGCWNALSKRGSAGDFGEDASPMRRAVAFSSTIKGSASVALAFDDISRALAAEAKDGPTLHCEAKHVDGTQNALLRNEKLAWLKAETDDPTICRVLSNARCLSEGVDVPALDAVLFLNPRNSIVDVVQSVGRVMRRAEGKKFGYVVIPVAVPAGMEADKALNHHARYKIVWDVLRALRSHDDRLEAEINTLDVTKPNSRLMVMGVGLGGTGTDADTTDGKPVQVQGVLDLAEAPAWREAVLARLVKNVGQRMYWDRWGKEVKDIADRHVTRITTLLNLPGTGVQKEFDAFLAGLQGSLNDKIKRDDAINMLAQHLVTRPVFRALFQDYDFVEHNAVAQVMERMLVKLDEHNLEAENRELGDFYESVRRRLAKVDDKGRLRFVNELYEKFFKAAFPKVADQLGIVYTPVEIVDFIIRSVEHLLNTEFDASLSDKGVHVLDPFTGTGTFIVRLLESGVIKQEDLLRKYTQELHCNEILLLAYYIAAINIEAAFHGIHGGEYVPFTGAVLADTFQSDEADDTLDEEVFAANNERLQKQRKLPIRVVIGNPPYSVGQGSQNDDAANLDYPTLDRAIETTYAARSSATNKNSLYDSYIRAIRWASDRIKGDGVIGFVTNGGFIDGNTADGIRKTLSEEFNEIYVFNLRGNARTAGVLRQKEKGNVFAEGGRTTIAVTFLVKRSVVSAGARIKYRDIGDYLTTEQKLQIVKSSEMDSIEWETIEPNDSGDWLNQRDTKFNAFTPIGSKDKGESGVFGMYSRGLATGRDAWVYNPSKPALEANVRRMVAFYNSQVDAFNGQFGGPGAKPLEPFLDLDPTTFSWNRSDKSQLARGKRYTTRAESFRVGAYRPFNKQRVCFDRDLNDMVYRMPSIFPAGQANFGIELTSAGSHFDFVPWATDAVPDLHLLDTGQFFPRYAYVEASSDDLFAAASDERYTRVDNITDEALADYRAKYGAEVSKDDVFYYVYGLLHSPDYRTAYAADLKRMLPRIAMVASADDFRAFADAGRKLADLHIGYETVEPWPLEISGEPASSVQGEPLYDWYRVEKMRFGGKSTDKDRSTVVYNSRITVSGIPDEAYEYLLGSRSGVEWVMDRYQVKVDKASQIKNDPNDWSREVEDPRYILDLLGRVVRVSVETVRIVAELPQLRLNE
jgi:predicted helicase